MKRGVCLPVYREDSMIFSASSSAPPRLRVECLYTRQISRDLPIPQLGISHKRSASLAPAPRAEPRPPPATPRSDRRLARPHRPGSNRPSPPEWHRPPWTKSIGASLFRHVVGEIELKHDSITLILGRKRWKRIARADRRDGRAIQWVAARLERPGHLRHAPGPGNREQQPDLAPSAKFDALRHHGEPVPPDCRQNLRQVRPEIDTHGITLQLQSAPLNTRRRRQIDALANPAGARSRVADREPAARILPRVLPDRLLH